MSDAVSVTREVEIINTQGLHARPVMKIVDLSARFSCRIRVLNGSVKADACQPMEMMLLAAPQGTRLTITAEGPDAAEAVEAIADLIARKFDEE